MEADIIKYFIFLFSSVFLLGGVKLWLQSNKIKREEQEKKAEELEIQKEIHRKALLNKK